MDTTWQMGLEAGEYRRQDIEDTRKWELQSAFGYTLRGVLAQPPEPKGVAVLCHGHRHSWHGTIKYWRIFRDMDYVICAYNHRYHGDSGGRNCSAGWFEARDLLHVVGTMRSQYPGLPIGLMGESMGGATVMQFMELGEPVDFIIADCPYSTMAGAYRHQLTKRRIPRLLQGPIITAAQWYIQLTAGFSLRDVSPARCAMKQDTPVLLIHGDGDTYIPKEHSREIYDLRRDTYPTRLLIVEDARHADAWRKGPGHYEHQVTSFIREAIEAQRESSTPGY